MVGLGYVGLPLAVAFAKVADVIGFDISREKVEQYHKGIDVTKEVGDKAVQETTAFLTWEEKYLKDCKFHIVAVPTPIKSDKSPDLTPVISASRQLGEISLKVLLSYMNLQSIQVLPKIFAYQF